MAVSNSPSSIASRNFFEPLALVRSPMIMNDVAALAPSWWKGVNE